jgi:hypothetical protein
VVVGLARLAPLAELVELESGIWNLVLNWNWIELELELRNWLLAAKRLALG